MSLLRSLSDGLRALFRKEQVSQELDEELNGFLEIAVEEKMKPQLGRLFLAEEDVPGRDNVVLSTSPL